MNYDDMIVGVESGTECGFESNWPAPLAIVRWTDGTIHIVGQTDMGQWSATDAQKAATNWNLAPYHGDLPPR